MNRVQKYGFHKPKQHEQEDKKMRSREIICVTTFRQGNSENVIKRTRSEVFLDTAHRILGAGLSLVVVHIETQESILRMLQQFGAVLIEQQTSGMGNIRREALSESQMHFPNARYFCWLEPEKPDLVRFIVPMANQMKKMQSDFGIFNRIDMASYPTEQAHYYLFCRAVATQLVGFDIDYAFGPMMMTPATIPYFLKFSGGEYGDKWDSILVPRLHIIKGGIKFSVLPVNFQNDERITRVESGNVAIVLKRLEQFNNVIPSLIAEWQLLNE